MCTVLTDTAKKAVWNIIVSAVHATQILLCCHSHMNPTAPDLLRKQRMSRRRVSISGAVRYIQLHGTHQSIQQRTLRWTWTTTRTRRA